MVSMVGTAARVCLITVSLLAIWAFVIVACVTGWDEANQMGEYLRMTAGWCRAGPGSIAVGLFQAIPTVFKSPYIPPAP